MNEPLDEKQLLEKISELEEQWKETHEARLAAEEKLRLNGKGQGGQVQHGHSHHVKSTHSQAFSS